MTDATTSLSLASVTAAREKHAALAARVSEMHRLHLWGEVDIDDLLEARRALRDFEDAQGSVLWDDDEE
jgi:hypothetical protein